jgi:hypothetical protein
MVTSPAEIFGKIGAAKSFTNASESLNNEIEGNTSRIDELEVRKAEFRQDSKEYRKTEREINRLRRKNKILTARQKSYKSANDFLANLCDALDIGMNEIVKWMSSFIVGVVPAVEISVKMLLLSNIKKMVSCSLDPMIPDEWRYNGILLNEVQIDPRKILRYSPFSKYGKYQYFGCYNEPDSGITETRRNDEGSILSDYNNPKNIHELARAQDMNAFLWYAKYNARFVSPIVIAPDEMQDKFENATSATTFFEQHEFIPKGDLRYIPGTVFKNSYDGRTLFLLEKVDETDEGKPKYTILPVSDTWESITWYKDRTTLTGMDKYKPDYNKSKPLFNIDFLGTDDSAKFSRYGNFRFRILPKPFSTAGGFIVDLHNNMNTMASIAMSPDVDVTDSATTKELIGDEINDVNIPNFKFQGIQSPIPYYARFNGKGDYDKRGRYSINTMMYDVLKIGYDSESKVYIYGIYENNQIEQGHEVAYLKFLKKKKVFVISDNDTPSDVNKASEELVAKLITECYFGNTVYEFNYDYVMSMKLFDAKVITASIIDTFLHMKFGINLNQINPFLKNGEDEEVLSDTDQIYIDSYVDKLIEKMIDTEEFEYTDCFYKFNNDDYVAMEKATADKVANMAFDVDNEQGAITAIYDSLEAYRADAVLQSRVECIEKAILGTVAACGYDDSNGLDGTGIGNGLSSGMSTMAEQRSELFFLIRTLLEVLISSVVNAILTPKVLMLIQVNRIMMQRSAFEGGRLDEFSQYSAENILNGMSGILQGIIREVIDSIHRELLRMILEKLSETMAAYLKKLGIEYAVKWVNILRSLLDCFKRNRSSVYAESAGNTIYKGPIDSIIDQVDYADLEILADEIVPNTNPC